PVSAGLDRYVSVRSSGSAFPPNRHFFGVLKDLVRTPTAPLINVTPVSPNELHVELRAPADAYVYFAHVTTPYESTMFSDNYVDLEAGEARELVVRDATRPLASSNLTLGWA